MANGVDAAGASLPETEAETGGALRRLSEWLRGRYLRIVDAGIPRRVHEEGGDDLREARIIVGFSLVLVVLGLEAAAFFHWALPSSGALAVELALVAGLALTFWAPTILRRSGSLELAANVVIGAAFLVLGVIFVVLGGIRAPVLHWCALAPMLCVMMGARRSAWIWCALAFAMIIGLAALDLSHWTLPSHLEASGLVGERLWLQRVVDVGSWIGVLFLVALVYERHKDLQTAELGTTNAELTREVAQRRKAEKRTRYLAYYDELTSLPNRQYFKEQLELAMRQAERDDRLVAVMFLDLDGFKEINDSYGHRLGDRLLQQVAERLRSCVRNADAVFRGVTDADPVVSRLGGDEFTVLLVKLRNEQEASIVARRVVHAFEEPFQLEDNEIYISASIGVALYPRDVRDMNELLKNADLAMYAAKDRGKNNYQFYTDSMNAEIVHRTTVAADLRKALEREEFVLHYQPIVRCYTREIVAVEALLRWRHPVHGMLRPDAFIEIAEETGLIVPISEAVMREACQQNKWWQDAGLPAIRMAVNVSGVQLRQQRLTDCVEVSLVESGLDPCFLDLEITESAMMEDEEEASRSLGRLKGLGVRVSLDDFGTGYSSLSYVKRFPVDALKIDRSFVKDATEDSEAEAITRAIVAMAHGLRLSVVAEGVETAAQERFLEGLGCDEFQGYRYAHPLPGDEVALLLRDGIVVSSATDGDTPDSPGGFPE